MALYSNTLQVIRHYLSSAVGDLIYGQCGTTGAIVTKTYAPFLWKADDYYNDNHYEVYVYAGVNIGLTRRVTDWVLTDKLLTVHTGYTAACDATSYAELHRIFTEDEYRKAINMAIESLGDTYLVPITDSTTIKLASTTDNLSNTIYTWEYDLPTTMIGIHTVIKEEAIAGFKLTGTVSGAFTQGETVTGGTSGATGDLAYGPAAGTYIRVRNVSGTFVVGETATGTDSEETCSAITAVEAEAAGNYRWLLKDEIDPREWSVVKQYPTTTAKLKLTRRGALDEDIYLRVEGERKQPILAADTETCYLPPDWIVQKAITFLPGNKIQSNKLDEVYRRAVIMSANAPFNFPNPRSRMIVE